MLWGLSLVEVAVILVAGASTLVGLYIAFLAYQGLRRHENRSMRYLSVGLIVLTAVTYATAFLGTLLLRLEVLPLPYQDWFRLVVRLLQFSGLAFIAYSLYIRD